MAFRPIPHLTPFLDNQGRPLAGGKLRFYTTGTTTPKVVYTDEDLSTSLGSTVTLDAAGRVPDQVWGSGDYRVRLYDAQDNLIDEADPVTEQGAAGVEFPSQAGNSGKVLMTDGATLAWQDFREVPDPTGNAQKVLSTDGENLIWIQKPADGAAGADATNVTSNTNGFTVGNFMVQTGTGNFPATGAQSSSVNVTFPTAMQSCIEVFIQMGGGTMFLHARRDTKSATGFTATADSNIFGQPINSAQPFTYMALGIKVP